MKQWVVLKLKKVEGYEEKDLKILKITFSGLAGILFYISGLWIVSAFFALLSLYFMDEKKEWDNKRNTL